MLHQNRPAILRMNSLAVGIAIVFATGCGRDRVSAPSSEAPPPGPIFIKELAPQDGNPFSFSDDDPVRVFEWIDGAEGGTIENGRFSLNFAPGAFPGRIKIELIDTTEDYLKCELYPEGIYFNAPVVLTVDVAETTGDDDMTTLYWNDRGDWTDVGSWYSSGEHTVSTNLEHFSEYAPGRAGW